MHLESLNPQDQLHVGKGKKKFKAVLSNNVHPHPWASGICVCVSVVMIRV